MSDLWNPLSDSFATTRNYLHQIAFFAVSPARHKAEARMGLKPTEGGFGTPRFDGTVVRVEGDQLVIERENSVSSQLITDIRSAAEFLAGSYQSVWFDDFQDPLAPMDPDTPLEIVPEDTTHIGAWFAYGFEVLNELGARGTAGDDVSEAQIWPEHFDAATELGDGDQGQRASFGASPGDGGTPEPYLYVAPWAEIETSDPYWNAAYFPGSILTFSALSEAEDVRDEAMRFFMAGYNRLHG